MDIRRLAFKYRGITPVPLIILLLLVADPSVTSFALGLPLVLIGEALRFWAVAHAGGATRTRRVGAGRLVRSGPYARSRNPIYIGNMLILTGFAMTARIWAPWLQLAAVGYFTLQYYLIIRLEEEKLEELFGDEYRRYCSAVPRLLPRLLPVRGDSSIGFGTGSGTEPGTGSGTEPGTGPGTEPGTETGTDAEGKPDFIAALRPEISTFLTLAVAGAFFLGRFWNVW